MNKRLVPGSGVKVRGCLIVNFGKARTTLKGDGGSGEPTTRESFHAVRRSMPNGLSAAADAAVTSRRTGAMNHDECTVTDSRRVR